MGHRIIPAVSISAALLLAAAAAPSLAQSQLPRPGQLPPADGQSPPPQQQQQRQQPAQQQQQQQPQQAAAKPYKPVAITAPEPVKDPSFEAFRKELNAIAEKKDRRALAGLVSRNFFWIGEKDDKADKKKPGIDNLAKAIDLDDKEGYGWDTLLGYAADPTGAAYQDRKDTICAPAAPGYNDQEFDALLKSTGTEDGDWAFPAQPGLEMRASAQPNAPVVEKLGMHFIRVMDDEGAANQQVPMVKAVAPSGKTGYIPADAVSPLGNDEICYVKEGGAWKIAGFIGGE
jgi:hypothetical protein